MIDLISLIITLLVIGVLMWLIDIIPMDGAIRTIIHVIVTIFVVLWLLQTFGLISRIHFW